MTQTQTATTQTMPKFDFDEFNRVLSPGGRKVPAGLLIVLAKGLLDDATYQVDRFNLGTPELANDLHAVGNDIRVFHGKWKAHQAARVAARAEIPAPVVIQRYIPGTPVEDEQEAA